MILLLHIGIAVLSLAFAGYTFIVPTQTKLTLSYALLAATLLTGTYLVIMAPAHMTEACMAGLFYTSIIIIASLLTRRKLAALTTSQKEAQK